MDTMYVSFRNFSCRATLAVLPGGRPHRPLSLFFSQKSIAFPFSYLCFFFFQTPTKSLSLLSLTLWAFPLTVWRPTHLVLCSNMLPSIVEAMVPLFLGFIWASALIPRFTLVCFSVYLSITNKIALELPSKCVF